MNSERLLRLGRRLCPAVSVLIVAFSTLPAQGDTGKPDSVFVSSVRFVSPPYPAQIQIPIMISSDDTITALQFHPSFQLEDGTPFSGIGISNFNLNGSVLQNVENSFVVINAGAISWFAYGGDAAIAPRGQFLSLELSVPNLDVPSGTQVFIDASAQSSITYRINGTEQDEPFPWVHSTDSADITILRGDTGKPDSIFVQQITFVSPPFPDSIEVPIMISSDDSISQFSLAFIPVTIDGPAGQFLAPSGFSHPDSPFDETPSPQWEPFEFVSGVNGGIVAWSDGSGASAPAPRGEMGRLVLDITSTTIPNGTRVRIDTVAVADFQNQVSYRANGYSVPQVAPWVSDTTEDISFSVVDTGIPDSVYVARVTFVSPPWPDQIEVPVMIYSDNTVAAWEMAMRPETDDGSSFTALKPAAFTHLNSVFNETGGAFWPPPQYYASTNALLFGWLDFSAAYAQSPVGEMGRLVLDVLDPNIEPGTRIYLDTLTVQTFYPEIDYAAGGWVSHQRLPWRRPHSGADIIFGAAQCGDFDGSGAISVSDAVYMINYIFAGGPAPTDTRQGDINCDGMVNITDAVYLINYIFLAGPMACADCSP